MNDQTKNKVPNAQTKEQKEQKEQKDGRSRLCIRSYSTNYGKEKA